MSIRFLILIFFNLLFFNLQGQSESSILDNCKRIDRKEFSQLRKINPDIQVSYILENGKNFTKKDSDSISNLLLSNKVKQLIYSDTINHKIILFYKTLTKLEIEAEEKIKKEKLEDDKTISKGINGTRIEELTLIDINNNEHTLESLKGNVIVINFWFAQCKPCIAEFPDLNKLKKEFKDKSVAFFAVSFNDKKMLNKFFEKHDLDYKIIPSGRLIIDKFKIPYYPYNIIIDKNGQVDYVSDTMPLNIFKKMKRKIKNLI